MHRIGIGLLQNECRQPDGRSCVASDRLGENLLLGRSRGSCRTISRCKCSLVMTQKRVGEASGSRRATVC